MNKTFCLSTYIRLLAGIAITNTAAMNILGHISWFSRKSLLCVCVGVELGCGLFASLLTVPEYFPVCCSNFIPINSV